MFSCLKRYQYIRVLSSRSVVSTRLLQCRVRPRPTSFAKKIRHRRRIQQYIAPSWRRRRTAPQCCDGAVARRRVRACACPCDRSGEKKGEGYRRRAGPFYARGACNAYTVCTARHSWRPLSTGPVGHPPLVPTRAPCTHERETLFLVIFSLFLFCFLRVHAGHTLGRLPLKETHLYTPIRACRRRRCTHYTSKQ